MPVRELNIRSVLMASPETVWEAWTNPDHLAKWWGPEGFTSTIRKMEVAKGGEWLLTMQGPDGKNYNNKRKQPQSYADKRRSDQRLSA